MPYEKIPLQLRFDPLGNHVQPQTFGHGDGRLHDRCFSRVGTEIANERRGNFQLLERHTGETG